MATTTTTIIMLEADDCEKRSLLFSGKPTRPRPIPRRRKMAVIRLGSRRWRGRRILAGLLRRLRLRWLEAKYRAALKRIHACQAALARDLKEGVAAMEAVHTRLLVEPYFAGPFIPVATVNYHPTYY